MKNLEELKTELIEYGRLAGVKNFTPGYSGNFSARFEDKILITSSGSSNGYLSKDELVLMDYDGHLVEGNKKPSSEKMLHAEFYKQRPDVNYIIHVHPPYLSSFACCHIALDEPIIRKCFLFRTNSFGRVWFTWFNRFG